MTSIFSGQLFRNFVKDQNYLRLENYDVNRFQRTVLQQADQGQREKELRESLEYQQAQMANLQTKLNEMTEKLNNLYRRYMDNQVAFRKVTQEPEYYGTSGVLNNLRSVTDPTAPINTGFPAGPPVGVVPFGDPGRVKNYSYNPYFGSKAIDESDQSMIRTFYQTPNSTEEQAYRENGAFWSTISYLWGWDLDRINATYATTDSERPLQGQAILGLSNVAGLAAGETLTITEGSVTRNYTVANITGNVVTLSSVLPSLPLAGATVSWDTGSATITSAVNENHDNLQVNVVAVQPNRAQYPPLRVGDRFPIRSGELPDESAAGYPYININGIRPGGADYNHAQFTDGVNEVGQDSLNWGWEFDDLPVALEVSSVDQLADGTTRPTGYKVVYDIPRTHPNYERYKHLDGTEPMILDAPEELVKTRIYQSSFSYNGLIEFGDGAFSGTYGTLFSPLPGRTNAGHPSGTNVSPYPVDFLENGATNPDDPNPPTNGQGTFMGSIVFEDCGTFDLDDARFSFNYSYNVIQDRQSGGYATPGDDGFVAFYQEHDWSGDSNSNFYLTGTGAPTTPGDTTPNSAPTAAMNNVALDGNDMLTLGTNRTRPGYDPFHTGSGASSSIFEQVAANNTGTGNDSGGTGPVVVTNGASYTDGATVRINGTGPNHTIVRIEGNNIYLSPNAAINVGDALVQVAPPVSQNALAGSGNGGPGGLRVADAATFSNGDAITITNGTLSHSATITSINTVTDEIFFNPPINADTQFIPGAGFQVQIDGSGGSYGGGSIEELNLKFRKDAAGRLVLDVYFQGDIHGLQVNIEDLKIVSYSGQLNGWNQGLYEAGDINLGDGEPTVVNNPDHVVNKYIPDQYNFTQFHNDYDLISSAANLQDIVRSPYEYALFNIGEETANGQESRLSGELWLDINTRRLNFEHEDYDNTAVQPDWHPGAVALNPDFALGANVQEVYGFIPVTYPDDDCIPPTGTLANRSGTAEDSDPYTNDRYNDGNVTPINATPADPTRTNNMGMGGIPGDYYTPDPSAPGGFVNPANGSEQTNTIDRIAGTNSNLDPDSYIDYRIMIPTTDLNVLQKQNDMVFNFGSLDGRNWSLDINEPFMEFRTVPDYVTVPRYRVDASGNIYDRFGKGAYDPANVDDQVALAELYTTQTYGSGTSTVPLRNGQVSNHDGDYDNAAYYDSNGDNDTVDRMSGENDDYNLFDYVPDLRDDPNNVDPNVLRGELYVGSMPTNFYYYRESLDNGAGGANVPTNSSDGTADNGNVNNFTGDKRPALNFDGRKLNADGSFAGAHTNVYNTEMPSFVNVTLGYVEQNAKYNNAGATTTMVTWDGFIGLGGETSAAQRITDQTGTIIDAVNVIGKSRDLAAQMQDGSSISLEMGVDTSLSGHMLVYESVSSFDDAFKQTSFVLGAGTGAAGSPVSVGDVGFFAPGDVIYYEAATGQMTQVTLTSVSPLGAPSPTPGQIEFNPPLGAAVSDGRFLKITPNYKPKAHVVPLPLEPGHQFTFESYQAYKTMSRSGSETRGTDTFIHVDDATGFFNPPLPDPLRLEIGFGANIEYRNITLNDINTGTHPHTIRVNPPLSAANMGLDVPVKMVAPTYSVSIGDGFGPNSEVTIAYDDNNTDLPGRLSAVEVSPEMDRVGRYLGDDVRTAGAETDAVMPEYFNDQPAGFLQPDAKLNLNLVGQDLDGNKTPRRLKEVRVTIDAGEQIILGPTGAIRQVYSTNDQTSMLGTVPGGLQDENGAWPIALFDEQNNPINLTGTDDLGILVGYYQGIESVTDLQNIVLVDVGEFNIGDVVNINGEQRAIADIDPATRTIELDKPLTVQPRVGDTLDLANSLGTRQISAYLNRSFAMSTNAPVQVEMIWEDYDVTGYPPQVSMPAGNGDYAESVGFSKPDPSAPVTADTYKGLNHLVANTGRTGGSTDNEFIVELKRIVDNPEYRELFRSNIVQNIFITASVTDPFNDMIASKIMLNWDRERRHMAVDQTSFMAYFKRTATT